MIPPQGRRRASRSHSRVKSKRRSFSPKKQNGYSNRRKAAKKIGHYDLKISDIRNEFAHKTSWKIVDAPGTILVFEDLGIKNMTVSAKGTISAPGNNVRQKAGLNKAILNVAWGRIKTYKKRGVRAVLNNEVHIKILKQVAFIKKSVRRAGAVRSDASASKPAERVSDVSALNADMQFSLKQETHPTTAIAV